MFVAALLFEMHLEFLMVVRRVGGEKWRVIDLRWACND